MDFELIERERGEWTVNCHTNGVIREVYIRDTNIFTANWIKEIYDTNGVKIKELIMGSGWLRTIYYQHGKRVLEEERYSNGFWEKYRCDSKGRMISRENSEGEYEEFDETL